MGMAMSCGLLRQPDGRESAGQGPCPGCPGEVGACLVTEIAIGASPGPNPHPSAARDYLTLA
jgi:hypothetical protein